MSRKQAIDKHIDLPQSNEISSTPSVTIHVTRSARGRTPAPSDLPPSLWQQTQEKVNALVALNLDLHQNAVLG